MQLQYYDLFYLFICTEEVKIQNNILNLIK